MTRPPTAVQGPASVAPHYRRAAGVLSRRTLRGVMVCPPGSDMPHHILSPGDDVWDELAESVSVNELVTRMQQLFDQESAADHIAAQHLAIEDDVTALLSSLIELGAIERVGDEVTDAGV